MFVDHNQKPELLVELLGQPGMERVLVFTRTKHGANKVVKQLSRAKIAAAAIHGNKSQSARTKALDGFHDGSIPILVATDLASRGIDVDNISHVINFDLPHEPEVYVHRIGRTGRAGLSGVAISFCEAAERDDLRQIQRLIGFEIPVDRDHAWHSPAAERARGADAKAPPKQPRPPRNSRGRQRSDRPRETTPAAHRSPRSRRPAGGQETGTQAPRPRRRRGPRRPGPGAPSK